MTLRRASILGFLSISLMFASCAEGGGTTIPGTAGDGVGAGGTGTPMCGNGAIDDGESCDCGPDGTDPTCMVTTSDCSALGDQTGPLLCDRAMCMFVMTMCMSSGGGSGTTGGGGAGG